MALTEKPPSTAEQHELAGLEPDDALRYLIDTLVPDDLRRRPARWLPPWAAAAPGTPGA